MVVADDTRRLKSKICYFEDMLLRSKNVYEIESLNCELRKMRMTLQKLEWGRLES